MKKKGIEMKIRKKTAKNNNLSKFREEMMARNKALVKRAIGHIVKIGGPVSYSSVSTVTYDIADEKKEEKGLTLQGISTSEIYRALVDAASSGQSLKEGSHKYQRVVSTLSKGDLQMSMHVLRVENAELKMKNSVLTQKLNESPETEQYVESIPESIISQVDKLKSVARSLVNRLCELELTFVDTRDYTLKLDVYNEIIMQKDALELFYKKEINEIKSKIS